MWDVTLRATDVKTKRQQNSDADGSTVRGRGQDEEGQAVACRGMAGDQAGGAHGGVDTVLRLHPRELCHVTVDPPQPNAPNNDPINRASGSCYSGSPGRRSAGER